MTKKRLATHNMAWVSVQLKKNFVIMDHFSLTEDLKWEFEF